MEKMGQWSPITMFLKKSYLKVRPAIYKTVVLNQEFSR
jgi:hypothetical protein